MSSVDYSIDHPDDENVQRILKPDNHGKVMSQLNPLKDGWRQLGQEFCIPEHEINAIEANNQSKTWGCFNATVAEWLKWNFKDDVKASKVKPNVDWLIRAVDTINSQHAIKLADEVYKVKISGLEGHSAQETKNTTVKATVKTGDKGVEETDSGPPDVEKYCPPLDNKIGAQRYEADLTKDINIIIVTATDTEYQAVMGQAKPMKDDEKYIQTRTNGITFNVAMYGRYKVVIIRTGQGVDNTSRKLQKIQAVVNAQYVIAIGVCYGMEEGEKRTKIGSILVPKRVKIISTHAHRDDEDELKTEDRNSGDTLYDIFENFHGFALDDDIDYKVNIKTGDDILVTEDSLVTSQDHKNLIKKKVSQALGGEMEAAAILQKDVKFEGIVIKAIADWGDMEKASCSQWKGFSAYVAAKYVWYQLSHIPEDELKTN